MCADDVQQVNGSLRGRVALITGARRGIGRAIMRRLSAHGAIVIFTCISRSEDFVVETEEMLSTAGRRYGMLEVDLSDEGARADLVARATSFFGAPDILINNAAFSGESHEPASRVSTQHMRKMFEVNVHAPIDLAQQALPLMIDAGWGRIVNLLSDSITQQQLPYLTAPEIVHGLTAYGATKSALQRFTQGLAAELHGTGVHVNGLYPHKVALTEAQSERALAGLRAQPQVGESLETMAEAAYQLITNSLTGLSTSSRSLLFMLQQPVHDLDGNQVVGDASTLPDVK
jgi:3-oxoacyl-[acyl-carrier protein] reductase